MLIIGHVGVLGGFVEHQAERYLADRGMYVTQNSRLTICVLREIRDRRFMYCVDFGNRD